MSTGWGQWCDLVMFNTKNPESLRYVNVFEHGDSSGCPLNITWSNMLHDAEPCRTLPLFRILCVVRQPSKSTSLSTESTAQVAELNKHTALPPRYQASGLKNTRASIRSTVSECCYTLKWNAWNAKYTHPKANCVEFELASMLRTSLLSHHIGT